MEPTDDVGGTLIEPISRAGSRPCWPYGELLRRRRLIAVAVLVSAFAIFGGFSMVTLLKVSSSGSAQLRSPRGHSPAPRRPVPADDATATIRATTVAKPNMNVTTTEPAADSRSTGVVAIGAASEPIASTTTTTETTVRVGTNVHAEVTELRPVIRTDTTPMSVPSNETIRIVSP